MDFRFPGLPAFLACPGVFPRMDFRHDLSFVCPSYQHGSMLSLFDIPVTSTLAAIVIALITYVGFVLLTQ